MRVDLGDTGKQQSDKFRKATDAFTAALLEHHGELYDAPILPPQPSKMLPPISNRAMAFACAMAFPPMILNRIEAIQRATLSEYPHFTMLDLKSQRRTGPVVRARQVAMYLAKKLTAASLPEIGRRFGGRDHTTVLHAVRKIEALILTDMILAAEINRIKDLIPEVKI